MSKVGPVLSEPDDAEFLGDVGLVRAGACDTLKIGQFKFDYVREMMIKKITGTRSYMIVDFGDRAVKIEGELTLTPAFYGYKNSIKNWESPYDKEVIKNDEKKQIIEQISNYRNPEFQIVLED